VKTHRDQCRTRGESSLTLDTPYESNRKPSRPDPRSLPKGFEEMVGTFVVWSGWNDENLGPVENLVNLEENDRI
jgi:hypothetical protein